MISIPKYFIICFAFISCASTLDDMSSEEFIRIIHNAQEIKIDSIQIISFSTRIQNNYTNYKNSSIANDSAKDDINNYSNCLSAGVISWRNADQRIINVKLYSFDQKDSCTIYSGILDKGDFKISFMSISILPTGKYLLKYDDKIDEVSFTHK